MVGGCDGEGVYSPGSSPDHGDQLPEGSSEEVAEHLSSSAPAILKDVIGQVEQHQPSVSVRWEGQGGTVKI